MKTGGPIAGQILIRHGWKCYNLQASDSIEKRGSADRLPEREPAEIKATYGESGGRV